eukprot:6192488-Pleurochrysis_carterae.AAC.2
MLLIETQHQSQKLRLVRRIALACTTIAVGSVALRARRVIPAYARLTAENATDTSDCDFKYGLDTAMDVLYVAGRVLMQDYSSLLMNYAYGASDALGLGEVSGALQLVAYAYDSVFSVDSDIVYNTCEVKPPCAMLDSR